MKKTRKILQIALISAIALLSLGPAAQAQYNFNKKVTVDHTRVFGIPSGYDYMKKITIDAARVGGTNTAPPAGFSAVKKITVNNAKVSGSSDLTDFPVLVSIPADAGLKTTAQGGQVTDSQGDDILFYDQTLSSQLDHEIESYDGTTGTLTAWVRIPTLKATADTVFYLAYGNSSINTSQENAAGIWDSNYVGVWHMTETDAVDSTSNGHTGTGGGDVAVDTSGKMGRGLSFDSYGDEVDLGTWNPSASSLTISAWVNWSGADSDNQAIVAKRSNWSDAGMMWQLHRDADPARILWYAKGSFVDFSSVDLSAGWNHVVLTHTDGGVPTLYLDGTAYAGSAVVNWNSGTDAILRIGKSDVAEESFNGTIEEVRISNIVRSAEWIETNYNNQNSPGSFMTIEDSGGQANFPVLVSLTSVDLKSPGRVTSANGYDMIFMDATLSGQLDHEIESYDAATGTLAAWVRVPVLKAGEDTVLYLCYGNSSVTASQENAAGVWDADYKGVWHMEG
ncbi:hypothetical protein D1BOALGB6SA_3117, partial [Olavius sp. associated proteobacterium Delta 1]